MASRSLKPASYLASAAQQAVQQPSRSPRPSFTRSSSSSSAVSTKSEDSFIAILRSLSANDRERDAALNSGGTSPRCHRPGDNTSTPRQITEDTPGRKRSQPIAIELPSRNLVAVYTPLSARGDLPGGYFPNHEDIGKPYRTHPFSSPHEHRNQISDPSSPTAMSASSSTLPSPSIETTPKPPPSILTPAFRTGVPVPDTLGLMMPLGKYHPSNYKSLSNTTPETDIASSSATPPPATNLAIPTSQTGRKRNRPKHEQRTSDVKRKLKQYQTEMIAQAKLAILPSTMAAQSASTPISPRLLPAGSPGPITPFELEESAGYLVAGSKVSLIARGMERERGNEMVEEEGRFEGNMPPVTRA